MDEALYIKRLAQSIMVGLVVFIFLGLYMQNKPIYQMELIDTGIVLDVGCVNGTYKSTITYDCSVDIEWEFNGLERMVLKFGVLPNDSIGKWCGTPYLKKYQCRYGRL